VPGGALRGRVSLLDGIKGRLGGLCIPRRKEFPVGSLGRATLRRSRGCHLSFILTEARRYVSRASVSGPGRMWCLISDGGGRELKRLKTGESLQGDRVVARKASWGESFDVNGGMRSGFWRQLTGGGERMY